MLRVTKGSVTVRETWTGLVEATGRRCLAAHADTADRAALDDLVRRAEDEFGRIDIAVANAGASARVTA